MLETETTIDRRLVTEATRLCQRYVDEVVLAFDLCPWAAPSLRAKRVQITVITEHFSQRNEWTAPALTATRRLAEASLHEQNELVLLVFPRCTLGRLEFDGFLREVRAQMAAERPDGGEDPYALAAFHPDAPADSASPERLIPFLRRSPDPLLQAVRTSSLSRLESVHGAGTGFVGPEALLAIARGAPAHEPLRLRIARENLGTFEREGRAAFEAVFQDLQADRARIYGELDSARVEAARRTPAP
ncbi:MAG TPA: DUF1415 family protein [Polyangiaceae bacterium]|nr:DUF1415 family protein [Polyangiaceae bacterium]